MRRTCSLFIVILALYGLATAQTSAPAQEEVKLGLISGRVVNGSTNAPVRKAKVSLRSTSSDNNSIADQGNARTTITDQDGNFTFDDLKAGGYSIAIEKTGYAGMGGGRMRTPQGARRISLGPGQEIKDFLVRLVPSCAISGRVLDQDGEPLPNTEVRAMKYRYVASRRRRLVPIDAAQTNDLGEYRIFGLAPGDYYVAVVPPAREDAEPEPGTKARTKYPTTYYPGTLDEGDAQVLPLRPSEETRANFELNPLRTVKVSGRASGLAGDRNGVRAVVMLESTGGDRGDNTFIRANADTFEFPSVLPGKYTVIVRGMSAEAQFMRMPMGRRSITVGNEDLDNVQVTVEPMRQQTIQGKISVDGAIAQNVEHLGVSLRPASWRSEEDESSMITGGFSRNTNKDGTFTIDVVGQGSVIAQVFGTGSGVEDYYTKSVHYAGRDVTTSGFNLSTKGQLEIEIGNDGARIDGVVVDEKDKPLAESAVVLVPEPSLRNLQEYYSREKTDQNGHFTIRGIRPGNYTIYAWDDLGDNEGAYYYDDFLKKYDDQSQSVKLDANGRSALKLKAISSAPAVEQVEH